MFLSLIFVCMYYKFGKKYKIKSLKKKRLQNDFPHKFYKLVNLCQNLGKSVIPKSACESPPRHEPGKPPKIRCQLEINTLVDQTFTK